MNNVRLRMEYSRSGVLSRSDVLEVSLRILALYVLELSFC